MIDNKLSQFYPFTETDLTANRNGRLSQAQKEKLTGRTSQAIKEKQIAVVIAFPLSVTLLGRLVYMLFHDLGQTQDFARESTIVGIVFLGLLGGVLLLASVYIFRLSLIRPNYLLKKVEGPINIIKDKHTVNDHSYTDYELHIGGQQFMVASALANAMVQGDVYAIYYSEGSFNGLREIQSGELLSKAKF